MSSSAPVNPPVDPPGRPRGQRTVLLLALLFFGPLALAFVLYYGANWRPPGHTNHGALIQPPRPLAGALFRGKWSLVYVGPGSCDAGCRKTLYYMHQTHLGLGRLYPRVQRVFLATAPCCDRPYLTREYPDLITVNAAAASTAAPAGAPAAASATGSAAAAAAAATLRGAFTPGERAAGIFVVDPRGNLMMRYDASRPPEGLLDDLKQLLGLSNIG